MSPFAFTLGTTYLVHRFQIIKILYLYGFYRSIDRIITYPKTDKLEETSNFIRIDDGNVSDDDKLIQRIKDDVNLKIVGCATDCSIILAGLFRWRDEFMTDAMDNIIITKYGVGILHIKYEPKGNNRTIRIELIKYREEVMMNRMCVCYILTALILIIVINKN
jgi:hypothetical protein